MIEHWVHLLCAGIRQAQYTDTWTCHIHREYRITSHTDITPPHPSRPSTQIIQTHNSHRHNTTPLHHSRPWSKSPTHSPRTPPTSPQPKHRHTSNTPPVPTGLVKPKPNPLIHSPPSPPTPPRAKHIHISHTPPTSLIPCITLIHTTSAALDTVPEPRVLHSPQPHLIHPPHQHCRQPRTITASQHTHMQHKQQYTHHSHSNHRIHIWYHDNLTDRPKTTT